MALLTQGIFRASPSLNGYLIWLERHVLDRLRAMRGHGENYSDVILRLVEIEATRR
jgi:hypothetical protein